MQERLSFGKTQRPHALGVEGHIQGLSDTVQHTATAAFIQQNIEEYFVSGACHLQLVLISF